MDQREFEDVFWSIHPQLLRYARGLVDATTAHDMVAATLLTLWQKNLTHVGDDRSQRQLRSLGFEVLKGHVSNEYRARKRRAALNDRLAAEPARPQIPDGPAVVDENSAASYWLAKLSKSDRHAVALFNAGYDTGEMADILGCSRTAAARRRDRAKGRLRDIVERERRAQA